MPTQDAALRAVAAEAINRDRTITGPYPAEALANSVVEAVLDPANRDALLEALGATRIGWKAPLTRLLHDDPRTPPPANAKAVYTIPDSRSFS